MLRSGMPLRIRTAPHRLGGAALRTDLFYLLLCFARYFTAEAMNSRKSGCAD